ncbi:hypothetical protein TgHK011_001873 [Trichoderma gracile]|nr:hypothetical protein TgHK011_001873 [Trichoderma gracile]
MTRDTNGIRFGPNNGSECSDGIDEPAASASTRKHRRFATTQHAYPHGPEHERRCPRDRPSQPPIQPAPVKRSDLLPPYIDGRHLRGQGGGAPGLVGAAATSSPNSGMQRQQQQQQAGGESSDRRDWAQPGVAAAGKESLGRGGPWLAPSSSGSTAAAAAAAPSAPPKAPLLTQHAPGVKTATVDDQNITSLTRDKGSIRGQKRRLSVGQAEAEFDQKRLLNIVQDLDKLEKEQKDFGQQQLRAIREGSV